LEILSKIVPVIDDVRVKNISIYDMRAVTPLYDYAIICTASSNRQVLATVDHLKKASIEQSFEIRNVEGANMGVWVLVDLSTVVVHIFTQEERDRYALDRLFSSLPQLDFEQFIKVQHHDKQTN
jgi:ribosome-associated protein